MSQSRFFAAGKFGAAKGVRGDIYVVAFTERPQDLFAMGAWYLDRFTSRFLPKHTVITEQGFDVDDSMQSPLSLISIQPERCRPHNKGFVVALPGLADRDLAKNLTHQLIYLPLHKLQAEPGEMFWRDLIGLTVFDSHGQPQGLITEMLETGANDVMVVSQAGSKKRTLVPYIPDQVVRQYDEQRKTIVLDWDFSE